MKQQIKKLTHDKNGQQTIFQVPNAPIIVWLVATVATHILPYGQANFAASLIAFGAIFTWAWMEAFMGDSPFRKALGAVLLVLIVLTRL